MSTFPGAVLEGVGRPFEIVDLTIEEPRAGEVLVRLEASGVCHSDYHVVKGEWGSEFPIVLGHEGAGVVEAVGPGVTRVVVGDHVVLSWVPSCGRCDLCLRGRTNLCTTAAATTYGGVLFDGTTRLRRDGREVYSYLAVGSFARYAVVPETGAVPIRRDVPFDRAALVGCAVTTGIGAVINTARVEPGASVLVIGCGGVGLSAIMGAGLVSAHPIIAVDRVASKLALARQLGATETIDASALAPAEVVAAVRELTGGRGADYAFEAIGLPATVELAIEATGAGGTAVIVGQTPDGSRASFDPLLLSDREKRIIGSNYGSSRPPIEFPRLLELSTVGKLDLDALISRRIRLDQVDEAFAAMADGEVARSVIVYG